MPFSGARLAAARAAAGLTQQQIAAAVGAAQTQVSDWERGSMDPRPRTIPELAALVGLDTLELMGADLDRPRLEDLRIAAGLTRSELAARVGMSYPRYRRIELGASHRDLPALLIAGIARELAVPAVTVQRAIALAREGC